MGIPSSDYNKYLSAIKAANDSKDKEALRQIQKQLIAKYGLDDEDAKALIKKFRYTVWYLKQIVFYWKEMNCNGIFLKKT